MIDLYSGSRTRRSHALVRNAIGRSWVTLTFSIGKISYIVKQLIHYGYALLQNLSLKQYP